MLFIDLSEYSNIVDPQYPKFEVKLFELYVIIPSLTQLNITPARYDTWFSKKLHD
jgi:hypothetical protein